MVSPGARKTKAIFIPRSLRRTLVGVRARQIFYKRVQGTVYIPRVNRLYHPPHRPVLPYSQDKKASSPARRSHRIMQSLGCISGQIRQYRSSRYAYRNVVYEDPC